MRSHRQNCDVSDITSELIACDAGHARAERRRERLSNAICAIVILAAILAAYSIAAAADNRAAAPSEPAVYASGPKHAQTGDRDNWPRADMSAPAGCGEPRP